MSIWRKVATTAAVLAIIAGLGAAATQPANAETPSCGRLCIELSSVEFGTGYILDVVNNDPAVGTPVTLAPASPTNQGEDFIYQAGDPVSDYIQAGLISTGMGPRWGKLYAFEIQYTPYGAPIGTCVGLAKPGVFATVTLQPCGVSARTLWIYDPLGTAATSPLALVSGATSGNFSHPVTLTGLLPPGLPVATSALATPPAPQQLWHLRQG